MVTKRTFSKQSDKINIWSDKIKKRCKLTIHDFYNGFYRSLKNIVSISNNQIAWKILLNLIKVLVLIDFPGFNLDKVCETKGIKVVYYISPKFGLGKSRIFKIKVCRWTNVIFPFKLNFIKF